MSVQKPANDRLMSNALGQTMRDSRQDYNQYASKTMARFTLLVIGFSTMLVLLMICF